MGNLDAPGVTDGTEDRLLVVPPDPVHLEPKVSTGEAAVRGAAGQVGVDEDHRGRLPGPSALVAGRRVQQREGLRPQVPLRDQRRSCDQTRVHEPNDAGR